MGKRCKTARMAMAAALLGTHSALADTLTVPDEYPTIQAAIDASVNGDEIIVRDGVYTGDGNRDLDFLGKAITLEGNVGAPSLCVIDIDASEGDPHRAFWFHTGEGGDSVIRGFTITNGFIDRGGAILCEAGVSPLIEDCIFENNFALADSVEDGGGAICLAFMAGATVQNAVFTSNHMEDSGVESIYEGGGAIVGQTGHTLTLIGCTFEGNTATSDTTDTYGGAAFLVFGTVSIEGCMFTGNSAKSTGGAILSAFCTMSQTGCTYVGNWSEFAGAIQDGDSVATYIDCTFEDNYTIDTGGDNSGGAYIGNLETDTTMTGCLFTNNTAARGGGAVGFHTATAQIDACTFIGNEAQSQSGGGVLANGNSVVTLNACRFEGNFTANRGGAVRIGSSSVTIVNSLLFNNQAALTGGGVAVAGNGGHLNLINSTLWGNLAGAGGGVAVTNQNASGATITNSILWGDAPDEIDDPFGLVTASYSNIQGGWAGTGNIDADPHFVDPAAGDLRLSSNSPSIDAGNSDEVPEGVDTDLDGNPRFHDDPCTVDTGIGDPPLVDMGAYEFQGTSSPCEAELIDFNIVTGTLLGGAVADLLSSNNQYVHTRSGFGESLIDLHHMEMLLSAQTTVDSPSLIDLRFETRIDEPAGTAQVRLLNHNTQQFDLVGQFALSNADTIDTIPDIDATNYVGGAGEIDLSIKHIVFVPFLAFTFESFIDQVEILVE